MPATELLVTLESYYDSAPRPFASVEDIGSFTLFVRRRADVGHSYYARPRLGLSSPIDVQDVRTALARQAELDVPQAVEWVDETTPSLLPAARSAGLDVEVCPLLVLEEPVALDPPTGYALELMPADSRHLGEVIGAVDAGFSDTDSAGAAPVHARREAIAEGLTAYVGAFEAAAGALGRAVGGGSHSPRGTTTELTGIAVLPAARRQGIGAAIAADLTADALDRGARTVFLSAQDDAVARVYERIGFSRVATACIVG